MVLITIETFWQKPVKYVLAQVSFSKLKRRTVSDSQLNLDRMNTSSMNVSDGDDKLLDDNLNEFNEFTDFTFTLYRILTFLSPANQPVDSSVWNQNVMNTTHV